MKKILSAILVLSPSAAFAQALSPLKDVSSVTDRLLAIGNTVIYVLIAFAVVYIVYYVVIYFIRNSADRGEAGLRIMWGIIGLFVIVSIWGLVNILVNTFATDNRVPKDRFPYPGNVVSDLKK